MTHFTSLFRSSVLVSSLGVTLASFADETFVQNGATYIVKSGELGVIDMPENPYKQGSNKSGASQKTQGLFKIYDAQGLKQHGAKLANHKKYQVVYKQVKNPRTHEVKEIPGLLSGQLIVQAKNIDSINTSLKLKKSFSDAGFYVYELAENQSIAAAIQEISSQPGVEKTTVEVIENLRVPM